MSVRQNKTPWMIVAILIGVIACLLIGIISAAASWLWSQNQTKTPATATPVLGSNLIPPTPLPTVLPIPPLAQEFDRWQRWSQDGTRVAGNNSVQVIGDSKYKQVVQFTRTNGQGDSGAAGLILPVDLDVSDYPHLYVQLIGKIDKEMGGNIANTNLNALPESAVQVRIKYPSAYGHTLEWFHGFYISSILGADEVHFTQVLENQYFNFLSFDLKALAVPPQKIQEIRVYGFGWEFQSQVAQFGLLASTNVMPSTDPIPPSKGHSSQTEMANEKQICEAQGGEWRPIGIVSFARCNLPTTDAGKVCSDRDDCEGICLAEVSQGEVSPALRDPVVIRKNGKCSTWRITVGCLMYVVDGVVRGACID